MSASSITPLAPFGDILDELETLAREHLLFYRVQVGSLLLRHFWADDAAAFSSHNPHKDARFELFFEKCGEALARYGLSKRQARNSVRASIVVRKVAIASDWSMRQLRAAVTAVRAGLPLDADPDQPGVQVLDVQETVRSLAPGRMVTRVEKLAVGALEAQVAVLRAGLT